MKTSKIILVNGDRYLMQHRDENAPLNPNCWSLVGGRADEGETAEECVIREVKEEINFDLTKFEKIRTLVDGGLTKTWFLGEIDKEIDELECNEGDEIRYCTKEEIFKLNLSPSTKEMLGHYFKEK